MSSNNLRSGKYEHLIWQQGFWKRNIELSKIAVRKNIQKAFRGWYNIKSRRSDDIVEDPFEIVYVPVDLIKRKLTRSRTASIYKRHGDLRKEGMIADGDWDSYAYDFSEHYAFIAFQQRFIEEMDWKDTVYGSEFYNKFNRKGIGRAGCKNWDEFTERHLERWEIMYRDIKENGYKLQGEFGGKPEYEVEVCVTREGEILHLSGKHRLSLAKILGIKEIPVLVNIWHRRYIDWLKDNCRPAKISTASAIKPILEGKIGILSKGQNEC